MKKRIITVIISTSLLLHSGPVFAAEYNKELFQGALYNTLQEYTVSEVTRIKDIPGYENKPGNIIGNINYRTKDIYVKSSRRDKEAIFYHEVGHILYKLKNVEQDGLFEELFTNADDADEISDYAMEDKGEFFADIFSYYMGVRDGLERPYSFSKYMEVMSNNPGLLDYMDKITYGSIRY